MNESRSSFHVDGATLGVPSSPSAIMALAGKTFALSATGERQADLEKLIKANGGVISRMVHRRCDFLVCTPAALLANTQSVRKAKEKFHDTVVMVLPSFVRDSIRDGALCHELERYDPEGADSSVLQQEEPLSSPTRPHSKTITLEELGLCEGDRIQVLVEMSDEPAQQWWPVRVALLPSGHLPSHFSITYEALPARGYEEETPSRARFGAKAGGIGALACDGPEDAARVEESHLYDLEEGVWRHWRRLAEDATREHHRPALTSVEHGADEAPSEPEGDTTTASVDHLHRSSVQRKRRYSHPTLPSLFKRYSAGRAFAIAARRATARRRLGDAWPRGLGLYATPTGRMRNG